MLGGAKGRHWHLLKKNFKLYIYGNNFYESACQNLDIAGFAGSLQTLRCLYKLVQACTSTGKKFVKILMKQVDEKERKCHSSINFHPFSNELEC
jgi:hypothetical protein